MDISMCSTGSDHILQSDSHRKEHAGGKCLGTNSKRAKRVRKAHEPDMRKFKSLSLQIPRKSQDGETISSRVQIRIRLVDR